MLTHKRRRGRYPQLRLKRGRKLKRRLAEFNHYTNKRSAGKGSEKSKELAKADLI